MWLGDHHKHLPGIIRHAATRPGLLLHDRHIESITGNLDPKEENLPQIENLYRVVRRRYRLCRMFAKLRISKASKFDRPNAKYSCIGFRLGLVKPRANRAACTASNERGDAYAG